MARFSLVALVLGLIAAVVVWRRSAVPLGPVGTAAVGAVAVPDTAAARHLLGRWRDRARRWRSVAAFPAVLVALVAGVASLDRVTFGVVDPTAGPLWSDPAVVALLAIALGGAAAELHQLRPRGGPRTATLQPREADDVRAPGSTVRRRVLAALTVLAGVLHVALAALGYGGAGIPWSLVLAAALLAGGVIVERRIAARPRPALPPDLRDADEAVRRLGARSVDLAAAGATLLLVRWGVLGGLGSITPHTGYDTPLGVAQLVIGWGCLAVALLWAFRSAPHRLLAETATGVRA